MGTFFSFGSVAEEISDNVVNAGSHRYIGYWEDLQDWEATLRESRPVRQSTPTLTDVQQITAIRDKWLGSNESIR